MTVRQKIKLGVPFTIVRPQTGEKEFEVENLHEGEIDGLKCEIKNTSSYVPPTAFIVDQAAKIIKIKGFEQIPQTTSLELLVQGIRAQKIVVEEKKVLLSDEALQAVKGAPKNTVSFIWRAIKFSFFGFLAASILLYMVKNTPFGDVVNNVYKHLNAAQVVSLLDKLDTRILSNRHSVYESEAFQALNKRYMAKHGEYNSLDKIYNFVGDREPADGEGDAQGFFVMKTLAVDENGLPLMFDKGDAEDHCEEMGGLLLTRGELEFYLADLYFKIENKFWPIDRKKTIREWASDEYSWLFGKSWIYLKEEGINPTDKKEINGFVVASNGKKAGFRCGFSENFYKAAK